MQQITLQPIPLQEFSVVITNFIYRIRVYDVGNNTMCADININGIDVILGVRCLHGSFLLPYESLEQSNGNFAFYDLVNESVFYTNFGATCQLYYFSPIDLGTLETSTNVN